MAVIISGTNGLSGVSTVNLANGSVTQNILANNVAGTGPAFSAYRNATQAVSNTTWTKVQYDNEYFDTNNNFDSTTNYRFTPTVAGYYQINASIASYGSSAPNYAQCAIYKNGSLFLYGSDFARQGLSNVSCVMYFNGSTDYIEIYAYISSTGTIVVGNGSSTVTFNGFLARAA